MPVFVILSEYPLIVQPADFIPAWSLLFTGLLSRTIIYIIPELAMKIKSLKESEKKHLLDVLEKTHWDLGKTSRLLKISLQRLKSKMKEYEISRPDPQGS